MMKTKTGGRMYQVRRNATFTERRSSILTLSPPIPLRIYTLPYWYNLPVLIFDTWALWRSGLSARAPRCQKLKLVGYTSMALARPFEQQQFGTADVEGVNLNFAFAYDHLLEFRTGLECYGLFYLDVDWHQQNCPDTKPCNLVALWTRSQQSIRIGRYGVSAYSGAGLSRRTSRINYTDVVCHCVCGAAMNFTWNHAQLSHARCQPAVLRHGAGCIPPSSILTCGLDVPPIPPTATRLLSPRCVLKSWGVALVVRLHIEFNRCTSNVVCGAVWSPVACWWKEIERGWF